MLILIYGFLSQLMKFITSMDIIMVIKRLIAKQAIVNEQVVIVLIARKASLFISQLVPK